MAEIKAYPEEALVFVDESGIDKYLHRGFGWSQKGQLVCGEVPGKKFARESFIAAKTKEKVFAPLCYEGTCNTKLFDYWVEKFLVPNILPGQIVILDNATFHKSAKARRHIENAGCKIVFLPAIKAS